MAHLTPFLHALILALLTFPSALANFINHPEDGVDKYITRPDIVSPRWQVKHHTEDKSLIAPGYWFVAPYERIGERRPGGAWIGPHIYDGEGGLIWSGSFMNDDRNIMDFKLSNVRGEDRLTMMLPPDEDGLILDNHYQILEKVPVGIKGKTLNMHEFSFSRDGASLLLMKRNLTHASRAQSEEIGFQGECSIMFAGFEERDAETWETKFEWTSDGVVPLDESTYGGPVKDRCTGGNWDYLHSNAFDKFPDGHYLLSARHSDTIYKISSDDGSILWRLGGKRNDFDMIQNFNFSRQHHARVRSQNETHTVISLFDNAKGEDNQKPTSAWSRAVIVALRTDTEPMTAELVQAFDHPYKEHAWRRGNFQILNNENAFVCWSEHSLQSEHSPDGTILWEARMEPNWIGTYRAFKHEYIGLPLDPPDVDSQAVYHPAAPSENGTTTTIHVSWNGATEVKEWRLYHTSADDEDHKSLLATFPRTSFETKFEYQGYAAYVLLEGIDGFGGALGISKLIKTVPADNMATAAVDAELAWLDSLEGTGHMIAHEAKHALSNPIATFFGGMVAMGVVIFVFWKVRGRRGAGRLGAGSGGEWWRRRGRYARVGEEGEWDEMKLDDVSSSESGGHRAQRESREQFRIDDDEDGDEDGEREGLNGRTPYVRQTSSTPAT